MSMNKASCLSQTLGVYHSLLGFLKEEISRVTNTVVDKEYRQALLDCYYKLSDYHYRSDLSPYYIYAIICDPRLGVSFLDSSVFDSERDEIEQHKQNFINLFRYQYYKAPSTSSQPIPSQLQPLPKSMKGRVNLTANFLATIRQGPGARAEDAVMKEINYLFRFEALAWDSDPLAFWKYESTDNLENLAHLARDILAIPGKYLRIELVSLYTPADINVDRVCCGS
ncbi:hypothetical protein BT69DRAFT_456338 [Atractiella rhizophila]|nr:hypothetical protein BT69DRAFT_456338 [Atractiella rhizophila]